MKSSLRSGSYPGARLVRLAALLGGAALSVTLGACGAAGPGERAADLPTPAVPAPAPPAPAPTSDTGNDFEQRVLELTNAARASGQTCGTARYPAAAPLADNAALHAAAHAHAQDMALRGFFDHVNPDGLDPFARMRAAGYTGFWTAGENIAAGQPTPEAVVAAWLASPGHCANLLNGNFKELGVGFYQGASGFFWTQDFGARF